MQEEWLPVEDNPDYVVSNYGYVKNSYSGKILSNSPVQNGMLTVAMVGDDGQRRRSTAILVAKAFLQKPQREDFNTPIHLDGDKANCRVDNLMWRPRWFAINYHLEKKHNPYRNFSHDICLLDTREVFDTLSEPSIKYGLLEKDVYNSLNKGTRVFPMGFKFIYLNN